MGPFWHILAHFGRGGPILANVGPFWANTGLTLSRLWASFEPTLSRRWADFGPMHGSMLPCSSMCVPHSSPGSPPMNSCDVVPPLRCLPWPSVALPPSEIFCTRIWLGSPMPHNAAFAFPPGTQVLLLLAAALVSLYDSNMCPCVPRESSS